VPVVQNGHEVAAALWRNGSGRVIAAIGKRTSWSVNGQEGGERAMQWDLGLQGQGLLIAMSLGFGVIAQLMVGRATPRWLWLIAAAGYFVGGLFISEVWFGWATQEELQPNIDGLSFDEVLLLGLVPGIVTVLVTRYVTRRVRRHSTNATLHRSGTRSR
jgi:hypothetical protein